MHWGLGPRQAGDRTGPPSCPLPLPENRVNVLGPLRVIWTRVAPPSRPSWDMHYPQRCL